MSINALKWAMEVETGNAMNKLVLFLLADLYNDLEDSAWPAVGTLAERGEMSRRTVQRALRDLELRGLIEPVGWVGNQADRKTRRYRLPISDAGRHSDMGRHTVHAGRQRVHAGRHSDAQSLIDPLEIQTPPTPPSKKRRKSQADRVLEVITKGAAE